MHPQRRVVHDMVIGFWQIVRALLQQGKEQLSIHLLRPALNNLLQFGFAIHDRLLETLAILLSLSSQHLSLVLQPTGFFLAIRFFDPRRLGADEHRRRTIAGRRQGARRLARRRGPSPRLVQNGLAGTRQADIRYEIRGLRVEFRAPIGYLAAL